MAKTHQNGLALLSLHVLAFLFLRLRPSMQHTVLYSPPSQQWCMVSGWWWWCFGFRSCMTAHGLKFTRVVESWHITKKIITNTLKPSRTFKSNQSARTTLHLYTTRNYGLASLALCEDFECIPVVWKVFSWYHVQTMFSSSSIFMIIVVATI